MSSDITREFIQPHDIKNICECCIIRLYMYIKRKTFAHSIVKTSGNGEKDIINQKLFASREVLLSMQWKC